MTACVVFLVSPCAAVYPLLMLPPSLRTQRSAAVVYDSVEAVSKAMKHGSTGELVQLELPLPEGPIGLKAWVAAHKAARPGNEQLQKQVGGLLIDL